MAFSPDGRKLVSVSRDRTWAVHEKRTSDEAEGDSSGNGAAAVWLETVARGSGGQRILWSCDWSPDSRYFITGSRDKRAIVWEPDESQSSYRISGKPLECGESVTAVAFAPVLVSEGAYLIAIGQDTGHISLHSWNSSPDENSTQWTLIAKLNQRLIFLEKKKKPINLH
jgi:elongator complex protein 2